MPEIETLGILEEIGALVSDRLQVVSYKWLSRNFLVSSNAAKKVLAEFVQKHKDELEVVYTVAGWLKKTPPTYHIRLVSGPKLAEAKHDFDGDCSVQVYSVQACIPKDPAAIWNAEFIQAEELFKQPISADNCLRDNRFCGVPNSFVKRGTEGAPLVISAPQTKGVGIPGQATGSPAPPQQMKLQQSSTKSVLQSSKVTPARIESDQSGSRDLQNKEADKDKVSLAVTKKKGQGDKSSAGIGGSLANFWGRAPSKSKSTNSTVEEKSIALKTNGVSDSADAQISAHETLEAAISDDDESDVNFKRASNGDGGKKRRIVLDDSDEDDYENAVNLGSPDPPKEKSFQDSKRKSKTLDIKNSTLNLHEMDECKPMLKEEKAIEVDANRPLKDDSSGMAASIEIQGRTDDVSTCNKSKAAYTAPGSPKRRKVLKTRIDERGREVTEVVWEAEEADTKDTNAKKNSGDNVKDPNACTVKVEDNAATNPVNRAAPTKKSPAVGGTVPPHTTGKTGNKKGANAKDPKQGNILSFFKKV